MKEDVEVKDGDVMADDDVRIQFANFGQQVAEESALRLHLLDLEHNDQTNELTKNQRHRLNCEPL